MARKYYIKTKKKSFFSLDKFMTVLEMRAFGWTYKGQKTKDAGYWNVSVNYDTGTATASRAFYTFLEFKRPQPYSRNFFFGLMETLMSIMSWIRRKLVFLVWIAAIALIVIGVLAGAEAGDKIMGMNPCVFGGILTLVIAYLPSVLFCLLGWGFRKIFKVDEKLKIDLEKNGYDPNQKI